ncbi:MAG: hypothetical protein IKL72_03860 [Firmicutes bacterium]|nr:hypothetical protein [Bacillota bacterium]
MLTPNEKYAIAKVIIGVIIMALAMIDITFYDFDTRKHEMSYGDRRGVYQGPVNEDGKPEGKGFLDLKNEAGVKYSYEGEFVDGHFEGKGRIEWIYDGDLKYEVGTYKNDEIIPLKDDEITDLFWYADGKYLYRCIECTGVVEREHAYTKEFITLNIMSDIENNDDALTVNIYDPDFKVETGDYVRIMGIVERCYTELNDAGEEKTVPIIAAYEYDVISYEEAISPELFEKDPDKKYLRPVWYTK